MFFKKTTTLLLVLFVIPPCALVEREVKTSNPPKKGFFSNFSLKSFIKRSFGIYPAKQKKAIQEITPGMTEHLSGLIKRPKKFDKVRINVFVHGTYGSEVARHSLVKFYKDNLSGSVYEKEVRTKLRVDMRAAYDRSLMYDEGFFSVDPEVINVEPELEEFAVLPLIKSFGKVSRYSDQKADDGKKVKELFYVFGWSGLLSQRARREAGLALFNSISEEREKLKVFLKKKGSRAIIENRVFAHSHGGNTTLNLAWVDALARGQSADNVYKLAPIISLEGLAGQIKSEYSKLLENVAPDHKQAAAVKSPYTMDKWLYKPKSRKDDSPLVDQLYLMATPIQKETWPLIFSNTFDHVVSYFSEGDNIQKSDIFSTEFSSERSLGEEVVKGANNLFSARDGSFKFTQIRVSLPTKEEFENIRIELGEKKPGSRGVVRNILDKRNPFVNTDGPSHLEFWFIYWKGLSKRLCIRPMPIVVFAPLLQKPWKIGSLLDIRFDHSTQGDLVIKMFKDEPNKGWATISVYPSMFYEATRDLFFSKMETLRNKKSVSSVEDMAMILGTS